MPTAILWLRRDLRLIDNPALFQAATAGFSIVPVFIWSPEEESPWVPGGASRVWLHHSLHSLQKNLGELGITLILRQGNSLEILRQLGRETSATHLCANALLEPHLVKRDAKIFQKLQGENWSVEVFSEAAYLHQPDQSLNSQEKPYQVFTPFYRSRFLKLHPERPYPKPEKILGAWLNIPSLSLKNLKLLPNVPWDISIATCTQPGEAQAWKSLDDFFQTHLSEYSKSRDFPARDGVSGMSPYLHFGEISCRSLWWACQKKDSNSEPWLRQLAWREFAYHLIHHFPTTTQVPLRHSFKSFPWRSDIKALTAWQRGLTGYPLVDAGMRELWQTGRMHNRVRMVAASFLVKHLLQPWQAGAKWFWDTLVDADLANNTMGWQWVAGCGADAAPYFRIFNPVTQSERFDPEGAYIRRWVPELGKLPTSLIHKPWEANALELGMANLQLGRDYPHPIIDHGFARERALNAYHQIKTNSKTDR